MIFTWRKPGAAHPRYAGPASFVPWPSGGGTPTPPALTLVWGDRVHQLGTASGTGNVTLTGNVLNRRTFGSVLNTNDYAYAMIASQTMDAMWEFGVVQMQGDGTLKRGTPTSSSNGGASVGFDGSLCDVFIDVPVAIVYTAFSTPGYSPVVR
jgi:hypothetical protein